MAMQLVQIIKALTVATVIHGFILSPLFGILPQAGKTTPSGSIEQPLVMPTRPLLPPPPVFRDVVAQEVSAQAGLGAMPPATRCGAAFGDIFNWPSGKIENLKKPAADFIYTIVEGKGVQDKKPLPLLAYN
jgi:hypothetical protein